MPQPLPKPVEYFCRAPFWKRFLMVSPLAPLAFVPVGETNLFMAVFVGVPLLLLALLVVVIGFVMVANLIGRLFL